jgi:thiamine-phosphate pyrophosphorylase
LIRYYITDRKQAARDLMQHVREAIAQGVDYVQLREKDLNAREQLHLLREILAAAEGTSTRVLINARADLALAARAHGVHLPSNSPSPREFRKLLDPRATIAVSCHSLEDVQQAEQQGANFVVLSPIYASPGKGEPIGLTALEQVTSKVAIPVFALGGVTWENAPDCLRAGAAGIAGIRLFQYPHS